MKPVLTPFKLCFAGILMLVIAAPTQAGDAGIYESLANIDIGRIFLTPSQRDRLDVQRLRPVSDSSGPTPGSDQSRLGSSAKKAAGYIISSRGTHRVWSGNDFVVSHLPPPESRKFPGDVDVKRHEPSDNGDEGDGDEDD